MIRIGQALEGFLEKHGVRRWAWQSEEEEYKEMQKAICDMDDAHVWHITEQDIDDGVRMWLSCSECGSIDTELICYVAHVKSDVTKRAVLEGGRRKLRARKKNLPGPKPPKVRKQDA